MDSAITIDKLDIPAEISKIKDAFIQKISPSRIYLFGSYAEGRQTEYSDYDFYIVVNNETKNIADLTALAYKSIRNIRTKAVDIIIGTEKRFEERKNQMSVEREVNNKGILLYG